MSEAPATPTTTPTHILIIEDDEGLADLEARRLRRKGMVVTAVHSLAEGIQVSSQQKPGLIVVDYRLPDGHAGQLLDWLHEAKQDVPVVVVTGNGDEHVAVEMMKWGARDYLIKNSQTLDLLPEVVGRVLEQERLRHELQEAQQRYQIIVDNISDVVVLSDPRGHIQYVSPTFERLTGYSPDTIRGRSWVSLVHPDDLDRFRVMGAKSANSPPVVEFRFCAAGGAWRWVEAVLQPMVDARGRLVQIISTARDVTAQRRLQEQLREAQRMEAIGRLAGGVAHDFNNLLTGILGASQLLQEQVSADHPFRADLDLIISSSQRAAGLTRQLLAFGRRQPMAFAPVQVNDVVTDICKLIERTIGTDITISLDLGPWVPPILADAGQLEQVLVNLAVNSRDAMPSGGDLMIASTAEELTPAFAEREGWARPGQFVCLTVTDTGTGMTEAVRARIFEPYFSTKAAYGGGTGLGLAMVHGIVTQHQGLIQVASEPGVGTEFKIYLPVADVEYLPAEDRDPAPEVNTGSETILVAEDEEAVRRLVERVLTAKGYRVVMTQNGRAALEQFQAEPGAYDLIILDAVMPEMNGKEAMTAIAAIRPEVPVLLMSGYAKDVRGDNLAALGNPVFLQKPFGPADLARQVRTVLDAR